jgi:hypothetical protein
LKVEKVQKMGWAGHSPDVNASEHAWPWIRRYATKRFSQSRTEEQCEDQWIEAVPITAMNAWVNGIPEVVRRIIRSGGKITFVAKEHLQFLMQ